MCSINKLAKMSSQTWNRLIRFVDDNDNETFGEPCVESDQDLTERLARNDLWAIQLQGDSPVSSFTRGEKIHVKALKDVLRKGDVPIVRCIGLNYIKHIKEGGRTPPPYPSVFIKPSTSIAAFDQDISIPKIAQDGTLDYEGELAIVIGKTGKDIPKDQALSYVAGYCASNDVSARGWQRDPKKAGGVPQWCFSKGFDDFCPLSPVIVSPSIVGNASDLHLQTRVNGEIRQDTSTGDLLFGVEDIVAFCSQGTTLEAGTVILTGTPSGVAMGMKEPKYLNDGDVVEVTISSLGGVKNKMAFVQ
ncbi:Fumarylacetoacetate hydrolase domain-containing protein 2 [Paramyrothecium foliicola]|nr:Fumarylacetoacetate hydrolase domain-containing protein 2 [Paramyrothecium foliicola]